MSVPPLKEVTEIPTPRVDAFTKMLYHDSCADAAGLPEYPGRECSPEEAYGMTVDLAKQLEREIEGLRIERNYAMQSLGYERECNALLKERLKKARAIADKMAAVVVESNGIRVKLGDDEWFNIQGEPVEDEVAYLESRGLLERHPNNDTLVFLYEEPFDEPLAFHSETPT